MLRIIYIEEIENLLLLLPSLVQQQERRASEFVANTRAWLARLEQAFTSGRLHQAGNIAGLRSGLLAAEQGQVPAGIEFRGRPSRSKVLHAASSQALQRAADVASMLIAENRPRLVDAERVAQQIVAAVVSNGLIPPRTKGLSNTEYLQILRRCFATIRDLESAAVHLEGLVGPHDALILLDRALAPHFDAASRAMHSSGRAQLSS